ncbi:F-box domain protein [Aspergillus floccosus]
MASITVLPSELLARIITFLDRSSLEAIRETSRLLSQFATPRLFDTLRLFPDEESYEVVDCITDDATLKKMVKKVYINTCEDDYDDYDEEEVELTKDFKDRIANFKHCPNVQSAVLRFDKHCSTGREEWMRESPQTIAFRTKTLGVFFKWLASFEAPLRELGIRNMQDVNVGDEKISANIEKALQNLRSLRLSIVTEHNDAAPEDDLDFPEPHDFFAQLPSMWLKPSASSLEHLTLSCDNYFGFYPKLELSEVHFPHLKSVAFGNYCFVRDSQLEWILSHEATLTSLSFDDCAILYDVCLAEEHLNWGPFQKSEMETRQELDGQVRAKYYRSYNTRWHDYFNSFRTKLPHLRQFLIGSNDWGDGVPFEKEAEVKICLRENRYKACYDGYGPSPYIEHDYGRLEWERIAPKCDDEDMDSLRLLFEKTGQRVAKIPFLSSFQGYISED